MKSSHVFNLVGLALAAGIAPMALPVTAAEYKHETRFSVTFSGIEIGKATFNIQFDDASYSLKGSGKTTGLAGWAAPTTGSVESAGSLNGNRLQPKMHTASMIEKKKRPESLVLAFSGDRVSEVKFDTIKPRKPRVAPKYIPIDTKHMAAVLDPASSLIVPMSGQDAKNGQKVCNQNLPIFDGETRYDIKLSYKSTKPVKTEGYDGYAYVCRLRFVPIAGHKKGHRTTREMAENKNMEIWLAPMQGVSVFSPVKFVIGTKYGRFNAIPEYFGAAG